MGRDTIQLENAVSTVSREYLLEFTSEYGILESLHPELPGPADPIVEFPEGKVGVYTKFFEFANFRWMSFSKRPGKNTPQCYTKPLDSLKNWNNRFFWVDNRVFPTVMDWRTSVPKDQMPSIGAYSVADVTILNTRRTSIQKQPEALLYLVGCTDDSCVYADMDLFSLISAPNPAKVKTETRSHAAHEVPLLTVTANCVIDMEDMTGTSGSSGTLFTVEKSPLDFSNEDPPPLITERIETEEQGHDELSQGIAPAGNPPYTKVAPGPDLEKETVSMGALVNKRHRKRGPSETEANEPPKVLRNDHVASHLSQSTLEGKSLAVIGIGTGPTISAPATQETPVHAECVSDPDPLSYAKPPPALEQDIASKSSRKAVVTKDPDSEKSTSFTSMVGSPGTRQVSMGSQLRLRFEQETKLLKKAVAQVARRDQRIQAREKHIKNLEALLEAEADMKDIVEAKNVELVKELEILRVQFFDLQVSNHQLSQQVSTLQSQVTGEERIKAAFKEFKEYDDDRVSSRCAEIDARLDVLSIDFDEELYPHMLTAIAGRRWVIGHGLRLAIMTCAESIELRKVFTDVMSARIAKGMSEGLKHGVEHEKPKVDLAAIEAYDPQPDIKNVTTLHALKDLKYPLVDQLEKLKDAPIDVIMSSLYLESDSRKDALQLIRELQDILLENAIAANISRAKKKKKCRVVCRVHKVGSTHHVKSDGIPVSVPTVASQGLAILLADAATQTDITEDEASLKLLRSKSLPHMYNLDWPWYRLWQGHKIRGRWGCNPLTRQANYKDA
nr:hypothetical protein [Tanacetum cinerariifolium]